jgi:hypothetical protein
MIASRNEASESASQAGYSLLFEILKNPNTVLD